MEKVYEFIDRQKLKLNNDNIVVLIAKLLYKLFSSKTFVGLANIIIPLWISIPIFVDKKTTKTNLIVCIAILIFINVLSSFALGYKFHINVISKGNQEIINNVNSLIKTYNERIADNKIMGLFEMISDDICKDLYMFFKGIFGIETRVSIIQQYPNPNNGEFYSMMISRTSKNTAKLGQYRDNSKVYYNDKQKYYKKILVDNKCGVVVLFREDIEERFYFETNRKQKKSKIQQYIALSQKAYGKNIAFILQIDVLQKNGFGRNEDEIEDFCEKYVDPFVRILQNVYLVETLNKNT